MEVYRYMSFERLKNIVENKSLYFVNPFKSWKDKREGFLYRSAKKCNELIKIDKELDKYVVSKAPIIEQLQNGGLYMEETTGEVLEWFGMRCQSWSKSENDDKMWKEYSYDNCAVSIAVDTSKLLSLHYGEQKIEGMNVEYVESLSVKDELEKAIGCCNEFYFPFILRTKLRSKYAFENEYRLYLTLLDSKGRFNGEDHQGVNVEINYNINVFINGVYCHPAASIDFKSNLKEYCNRHTLRVRE